MTGEIDSLLSRNTLEAKTSMLADAITQTRIYKEGLTWKRDPG